MQLTRTLHAPAGADPILILMVGQLSWDFLLVPVLLSSVLLVLVALVVNNIAGKKWPNYW